MIGLRSDALHLFWRCGDLPLYLARAAFPQHDPLIQLDHDIAFPNGAREALDLVPRWGGWMWHADACRAFPERLMVHPALDAEEHAARTKAAQAPRAEAATAARRLCGEAKRADARAGV